MATIFDVAEKAGVSVITVSRLLNNPQKVSSQTSDRILKVINDLNFQPSQIARSLVKKRTNTIGIIIPNVKNTFFNNWFRFVEDYAGINNFNLLLCSTDEDPIKEMKYIKLFQSQRVDGVVIAPCSIKSVEYLIKSNLNFILVDRIYKKINTNFITTNHYQGAYDITEYLIKLGHRKIALLKGGGILYPDKERFSGFRDAMKKYHIKIKKDFILNCNFDESAAYKATEELLSEKIIPSAIFSFNSLMTLGAIRAIQKLKLSIPEDISLVCFDEIPGYTIYQPTITHILQPIELIGKNSIASLINLIENSGSFKKTRIFLKPKMVIGNSCKRIYKKSKIEICANKQAV